MSIGESKLVKAKAKLAVLEKAERLAIKARDKATAVATKAVDAAHKQREKVDRLQTTPEERAARDGS